MCEALDVDAAEVQGLRQEITSRISLMNALVTLELAALGTGLSISNHSVHVMAGLAAISSFLWLLWIDQAISTYKVAAYLAIEVSPRLSELAGRPILGWEKFLRRIEAGGSESALALHRDSAPPHVQVTRAVRADWYVSLLFGITPPLLLTLYGVAGVRENVGPVLITLSCLIGVLMWIFSIRRFMDFVHNAKVIDNAILAAGRGSAQADVGVA